MKLLKFASTTMREEDWKYGPVYSVSGDTFPIKTQLRDLGFSWSNFKKCWYIAKSKFPTDSIRRKNLYDSLSALGIKIDINDSPVSPESGVSPETGRSPVVTPRESSFLSGEEYPIESQTSGEERVRSQYSFPIEKNIYSFDLSFEIDGDEHIEPVIINRYYKKGKTSDTYRVTFNREYRDYPFYEILIGDRAFDHEAIKKLFGSSKIYDKKWGTYNEREFIEGYLIPEIKKAVESKPKSFKIEYDYRERTPELNNFLSDIKSSHYDSKNVLYDISLSSDLYNGDFPVSVHYNAPSLYNKIGDVDAYPAVEHEKAKRVSFSDSLFKIDLYGIHTIEELDVAISNALESDVSKSKYIKYLDSFPYADVSSKEGFVDYSEISSILENPAANIDKVISKLREKGYVRPNKRKRGVDLPDSKKILNDFYRSDVNLDFFYTFIAYQLHYYYKDYHTRSFVSFSYVFDIDKLYRLLEKFGEVNKRSVLSSIEILSEGCYSKLFGQRTNGTWENYNDFYGGNSGAESSSASPSSNALYDLKSIADQNGIDTNDIENNAYRIYRQLAIMWHPDRNSDKEEATSMMQTINSVWDNVPMEYKQRTSSNWYKNFCCFS